MRYVPGIETVLVGYSTDLFRVLDTLVPPRSVLVFDEAEMIRTRGLEARASAHACFAELLALGIHDEHAAALPHAAVPAPPQAARVISATDYGVVWAAVLAEAWALPGAGRRAAAIFRDKLRLRRAMDGVVSQPDWTEVRSLTQAEAFAARHGGRIVLKPSNLQGSLGVQIVPAGELTAAWRRCTTATDPNVRAASQVTAPRIAEAFVAGPEMSVEALVHDGQLLFTNVTKKSVQPGVHPVETGHVVPAGGLSAAARKALDDALATVIAASTFRTGIVHSEWILSGNVPVLVECAGRPPGDGICTLISLAYGFDFLGAWLALMRGRRPCIPKAPVATAEAALLRVPLAEEVIADAHAAMAAVRGVRSVALAPASPGEVCSSRDRNVSVIASGVDERATRAAVTEALSILSGYAMSSAHGTARLA